MAASKNQVTDLLQRWKSGDEEALERLTPLVYDQLHRLAHQYIRRERRGHTLQTSALEAEALVKIAGGKQKGLIHFHHTAYNIACAYALMNRSKEAVDWLQKAADDGLPCYSLFLRDQNLNNLRGHRGFINFMEKQKEQWEHHKNYLVKH